MVTSCLAFLISLCSFLTLLYDFISFVTWALLCGVVVEPEGITTTPYGSCYLRDSYHHMFRDHMLFLSSHDLLVTCYCYFTWLWKSSHVISFSHDYHVTWGKVLGPKTYNLTKGLLFAFSRLLRVYKLNFFNPLFSSFLSFPQAAQNTLI